MQNHVKSVSDGATRKGIKVMIRQHPEKFLRNHIFIMVFHEVNLFEDGVNVSENFDAIKSPVAKISSHLCVTDKGVINKEAIKKELATYNHESQCAKEYVVPPDEVLRKEYERTLLEKFTRIFKEMKSTGMTKSAIVIECDFLYHLSKEFCDTHLRHIVGEQLFEKGQQQYNLYPCPSVIPYYCWPSKTYPIDTNQQYCRLSCQLEATPHFEGHQQ
jgi:hypothetical protein